MHLGSHPTIFGDDSVLEALVRVGRRPRTFAHLVQAGFPPSQLHQARQHYAGTAQSAPQREAAQRMLSADQFFEDESLLELLTRFYHCHEWRLAASRWFFSAADYERFTEQLIAPLCFVQHRLAAAEDASHWEPLFMHRPFEIALADAQRSVWTQLLEHPFPWDQDLHYEHHRARQICLYLRRLDGCDFSPTKARYRWEFALRHRLAEAMEGFTEALAHALSRWHDRRQQEAGSGFHYRGFRQETRTSGAHSRSSVFRLTPHDIDEALRTLGLQAPEVTHETLKNAFRRRSQELHPDHGGSKQGFQHLCSCRETIEAWLLSTPPAAPERSHTP